LWTISNEVIIEYPATRYVNDLLPMYYSDFGDLTHLKCGGIFNNYRIANCSQYVPVKKF